MEMVKGGNKGGGVTLLFHKEMIVEMVESGNGRNGGTATFVIE